jgi:hypothetical protein
MYSTITGTIAKSAADVQGNCQGAGGGEVKEDAAETVVLDEGAEEEEAAAAAGGQTGGAQTPAGGIVPQLFVGACVRCACACSVFVTCE